MKPWSSQRRIFRLFPAHYRGRQRRPFSSIGHLAIGGPRLERSSSRWTHTGASMTWPYACRDDWRPAKTLSRIRHKPPASSWTKTYTCPSTSAGCGPKSLSCRIPSTASLFVEPYVTARRARSCALSCAAFWRRPAPPPRFGKLAAVARSLVIAPVCKRRRRRLPRGCPGAVLNRGRELAGNGYPKPS